MTLTKKDVIDAVCEACPHAAEKKKEKGIGSMIAKMAKSTYDATYEEALKQEKKGWRLWMRNKGWRKKSVEEIAEEKANDAAHETVLGFMGYH